MGIRGIFRDFLDRNKTVTVNVAYSQDIEQAAIESYALSVVINLISNLLSKCEIQTYEDGKPVKKSFWYRLNVLPNKNQSKTEFWREIWQRLILSGEVLIVPQRGELYIADGFSRDDKVIVSTKFTNIGRQTYNFGTLLMDEVFYYKLNDPTARFTINSILSGYAKLIGATQNAVIADTGLKGTLEVPQQARGSPTFEKDFNELMNDYFKTFFKSNNAVIPLFNGMKFNPTSLTAKTVSRTTEYETLFTDAIKRCAQALGVAPALLNGDIAGIKEALDLTLTACIDPLAQGMGAMLTARNYEPQEVYKNGKFVKIDTSAVKHIDIIECAENIDKLIASGYQSIDEVRKETGLHELGTDWSRKHWITKNYADISDPAGGDNND